MNIFVAKLSPKTTNDTLLNLFEEFGEVESAKVIFDKETGRSKAYGFVEMPNSEEATRAIDELNNSEFEGSQIVVKVSQPREKGPRRSY